MDAAASAHLVANLKKTQGPSRPRAYMGVQRDDAASIRHSSGSLWEASYGSFLSNLYLCSSLPKSKLARYKTWES